MKLTVLELFDFLNRSKDVSIVVDKLFLSQLYSQHDTIEGTLSEVHDLIPSSTPIGDYMAGTCGSIIFSKTNPNISLRTKTLCKISFPDNPIIGRCTILMNQYKTYPIIKVGNYVAQRIRLVSDVPAVLDSLFSQYDCVDEFKQTYGSKHATDYTVDLTQLELYPQVDLERLEQVIVDYQTYDLKRKMYERVLPQEEKISNNYAGLLLNALMAAEIITEEDSQERIDEILQYCKSIGITDVGYNPRSTVNEAADCSKKEIKVSIAKFSKIPRVIDVQCKLSSGKKMTDSELLLLEFMTDDVTKRQKEEDYENVLDKIKSSTLEYLSYVFEATLNKNEVDKEVEFHKIVNAYGGDPLTLSIKCAITA